MCPVKGSVGPFRPTVCGGTVYTVPTHIYQRCQSSMKCDPVGRHCDVPHAGESGEMAYSRPEVLLTVLKTNQQDWGDQVGELVLCRSIGFCPHRWRRKSKRFSRFRQLSKVRLSVSEVLLRLAYSMYIVSCLRITITRCHQGQTYISHSVKYANTNVVSQIYPWERQLLNEFHDLLFDFQSSPFEVQLERRTFLAKVQV